MDEQAFHEMRQTCVVISCSVCLTYKRRTDKHVTLLILCHPFTIVTSIGPRHVPRTGDSRSAGLCLLSGLHVVSNRVHDSADCGPQHRQRLRHPLERIHQPVHRVHLLLAVQLDRSFYSLSHRMQGFDGIGCHVLLVRLQLPNNEKQT